MKRLGVLWALVGAFDRSRAWRPHTALGRRDGGHGHAKLFRVEQPQVAPARHVVGINDYLVPARQCAGKPIPEKTKISQGGLHGETGVAVALVVAVCRGWCLAVPHGPEHVPGKAQLGPQVKPIPLSDKILLDRERCIMCYRCVRFTREIAGDETLTVLDRGSWSQIGVMEGRTFDSPFSGNTIEICPVGALTSSMYRFRARPWDIEDAGSVCTLCPSQCNIAFTVRDERVERVLARDNEAVERYDEPLRRWFNCDDRQDGQCHTHPGRVVAVL